MYVATPWFMVLAKVGSGTQLVTQVAFFVFLGLLKIFSHKPFLNQFLSLLRFRQKYGFSEFNSDTYGPIALKVRTVQAQYSQTQSCLSLN